MAVRAVERLLEPCSRLRAEIPVGDRTPITDGFIDLYERAPDGAQAVGRADITGRVAVQVKGKSHYNKRAFAADSFSYAIEAEVLRFFRDNGGGMYFCVLLHPDTGAERVFAKPLYPFLLNRLIIGMKPGQKKLSVKLDYLADDPARIERAVAFALETSKQDVRQGFDESLWQNDTRIELHSIDGIDLSRPAELRLGQQDFAVVLYSGGLRVHVDMDLDIFPAHYQEHEAVIDVTCGGARYDTVQLKTLDDSTGQMRLGDSVILRFDDDGRRLSAQLDLAASSDLVDHVRALRFFSALADRQELQIGSRIVQPDKTTRASLDGLAEAVERFEALSELCEELHVDQRLVRPTEITPEQMNILRVAHRAIVHGEELTSDSGRAGRFDVHIGSFYRIVLLAIPGGSEHTWRFFDPFTPHNRSRYQLFSVEQGREPVPIAGTAFEPVNNAEIASVLNMQLPQIVASYAALEDQNTARALANRKILQLVGGADSVTSDVRRSALLAAAQSLNEWLLEGREEDPIHLINRWQIAHRLGELTPPQREQIRDLRRASITSGEPHAGQLEACCAILLGDAEDIRHSVRSLEPDRADALKQWPIWALVPQESVA